MSSATRLPADPIHTQETWALAPDGAQRMDLPAAGSPVHARAVRGPGHCLPRETGDPATGARGCELQRPEGWSHVDGVPRGLSEGDCRQPSDRERQVGQSQTGLTGLQGGARGCSWLCPCVQGPVDSCRYALGRGSQREGCFPLTHKTDVPFSLWARVSDCPRICPAPPGGEQNGFSSACFMYCPFL